MTPNSNVFPKLSLIVLLLFSFYLKSNAQEGAYWMGLSTENPALLGTPSDWILVSARFAEIKGYDVDYNSFAMFSDYEISPKAGSVGANFVWAKLGDETHYLADVAYAYTLLLKKNRELNFGTSIGIDGLERVYNMGIPETNFKVKSLKTSIGGLYHSRKLDLGLSYGVYHELENEIGPYSFFDNYVSFLTAYRFIIKDKFMIEPNLRMVFEEDDNDGYLGLHLEYDDSVWLGYVLEGANERQSIMAGFDISQCLRIAFNYSFSEKYSSGRTNFYQFTMGYRLN